MIRGIALRTGHHFWILIGRLIRIPMRNRQNGSCIRAVIRFGMMITGRLGVEKDWRSEGLEGDVDDVNINPNRNVAAVNIVAYFLFRGSISASLSSWQPAPSSP